MLVHCGPEPPALLSCAFLHHIVTGVDCGELVSDSIGVVLVVHPGW